MAPVESKNQNHKKIRPANTGILQFSITTKKKLQLNEVNINWNTAAVLYKITSI